MKDIFNFVLVLALILIILYSCNKNKGKSNDPISQFEKIDKDMKRNLGRKILFEKDSLTIVDYSIFNESYTLSNGIKINKSLVK